MSSDMSVDPSASVDSGPDHVAVSDMRLDVGKLMDLVSDPGAGATVTFTGTTRDNFEGKRVVRLEYEAYAPMAVKEMRAICEMLRSKWNLKRVAMEHRVGLCPVGEASVAIAVSSVHRREALRAAECAIDTLKARVPVWKREVYDDGSVWKENAESRKRKALSSTPMIAFDAKNIAAPHDGDAADPAVQLRDMNFSYRTYSGMRQVLFDVSLTLYPGCCCVLLGANGAGKSTMLRIIAGKHLVPEGQVEVLGKPAFLQTLGISGISFLGDTWTRTIAFAGKGVPYQADIPVREMMASVQEEFKERRDHLVEILEIDMDWRMHEVSDGQRRRVQIMLGLLRPFKVLLIDEMTVDLDVVARKDFLNYLKREAQQQGAVVLYATHIYDGMDGENWATHLAYMDSGRLLGVEKYPEAVRKSSSPNLYQHVVRYLEERRAVRTAELEEAREKAMRAPPKAPEPEKPHVPFADRPDCGFGSGRQMAYWRG